MDYVPLHELTEDAKHFDFQQEILPAKLLNEGFPI